MALAAGRAGRRFHLMTMSGDPGAQTVPEVKPGIAGWLFRVIPQKMQR